MKANEVLEKIDAFTEDERAEILPNVIEAFSPPSKATLDEFMSEWLPTKTYEEFVLAQNKSIKKCIQLEMSILGISVRGVVGLPAFNSIEF